MKITHFYHVFADGDWETPAEEHIEALVASELIDNLSDMFLGIVGAPPNRDRVKRKLPGVVVAEAEGWIGLNKPIAKNMRGVYPHLGDFWRSNAS